MAIDVYLQIDGIKGESNDSAHMGWIEISSAQLGVSQPKSAMRADGQGERIKYYEVELENVLIGNISQTVHEGDILHDSFGLKFSKIKWKYTQQKIGGGAGGNTYGGWDLSTNRVV